ncbi:hypothetical protein GYB57_13865 [bacterium]|nr:hypothetical protein [bacterium]
MKTLPISLILITLFIQSCKSQLSEKEYSDWFASNQKLLNKEMKVNEVNIKCNYIPFEIRYIHETAINQDIYFKLEFYQSVELIDTFQVEEFRSFLRYQLESYVFLNNSIKPSLYHYEGQSGLRKTDFVLLTFSKDDISEDYLDLTIEKNPFIPQPISFHFEWNVFPTLKNINFEI